MAVPAWAEYVEQVRELLSNPWPGIVLVGDGVDAKLRNQTLEFGRGTRRAESQQRLSQRFRPTPASDPKRTRIWLVQLRNDAAGALGFFALAVPPPALHGLSCSTDRFYRLRLWIGRDI